MLHITGVLISTFKSSHGLKVNFLLNSTQITEKNPLCVRVTNRREYSATSIEISARDVLTEEPVADSIISVEIVAFMAQTLLPARTFFPY